MNAGIKKKILIIGHGKGNCSAILSAAEDR
jgi:hypothetical protein